MSRLYKPLWLSIIGLVVVLFAVACADDPTPTPRPTASPTPTAAPLKAEDLACDTVGSALATRCMNFYTDFWPLMEIEMEKLYKDALAEGGKLVVWEFGEVTQPIVTAFSERWPGIEISSRGLQFGVGAGLVEASRAGVTMPDVTGGGYSITEAAVDADLFDKTINWQALGVPKEFLDPALPYMLLQSTAGTYNTWYNTDALSDADVPVDPFDFLDPKWKGEIASHTPYFFGGFSFIAMKFGEDKAIDLANKLLDEQDLAITSDPETTLLTGERRIIFPSFQPINTSRGEPVAPKPYMGMGIQVPQQGILKGAEHPNAAKLYILWEIYDPEWKAKQIADPRAESQVFWGIPDFPDQVPKVKVLLEGAEKGYAVYLTHDNYRERGRLTGVFRELVTSR